MVNDLVFLKGNTPITDSLVIAEGTGVQHKNVLELIRKHNDQITRWGEVRFRRLKRENPLGGRPVEIALGFLLRDRAHCIIYIRRLNSDFPSLSSLIAKKR